MQYAKAYWVDRCFCKPLSLVFSKSFSWVKGLIVLGLVLCLWMQPITGSWAVELTPPESLSVDLEPPSSGRNGIDADAISSEKISQFVEAYLKVVHLIEQREGDVQGAETDSESLQARQQIESEALSAIEATGLTLQEYLQLLSLANIDPEFSERIAAQLQEADY